MLPVLHAPVCRHLCVVLCSFITRIDWCNHHHNQNTSSLLPSMTKPSTWQPLIGCHLCIFICQEFPYIESLVYNFMIVSYTQHYSFDIFQSVMCIRLCFFLSFHNISRYWVTQLWNHLHIEVLLSWFALGFFLANKIVMDVYILVFVLK